MHKANASAKQKEPSPPSPPTTPTLQKNQYDLFHLHLQNFFKIECVNLHIEIQHKKE